MGFVRSSDGTLSFPRLVKVAKLVLILPHSNAAEERVFSIVTKNKTALRPNLSLDWTLSSILTIKLANPEPCSDYEPHDTVLNQAKKATTKYNDRHWICVFVCVCFRLCHYYSHAYSHTLIKSFSRNKLIKPYANPLYTGWHLWHALIKIEYSIACDPLVLSDTFFICILLCVKFWMYPRNSLAPSRVLHRTYLVCCLIVEFKSRSYRP